MNKIDKVAALLGGDGSLRLVTWDSRTREVWLDFFGDGGQDCVPPFANFQGLINDFNLLTLGGADSPDAELTDAQLRLFNLTPDLFDLRSMPPGDVKYVAVRITLADPGTGDQWSLDFGDRADDTDGNDDLARRLKVTGGPGVDAGGFSDSWVIEVGIDDYSMAWFRGGGPGSGRIPCGFFSLPFQMTVVKR